MRKLYGTFFAAAITGTRPLPDAKIGPIGAFVKNDSLHRTNPLYFQQ
jgi:hypothetical protein